MHLQTLANVLGNILCFVLSPLFRFVDFSLGRLLAHWLHLCRARLLQHCDTLHPNRGDIASLSLARGRSQNQVSVVDLLSAQYRDDAIPGLDESNLRARGHIILDLQRSCQLFAPHFDCYRQIQFFLFDILFFVCGQVKCWIF